MNTSYCPVLLLIVLSCCPALADNGHGVTVPPRVTPTAREFTTVAPDIKDEQWTTVAVCPATLNCPKSNCPDSCRVTRIPEIIPPGGVTEIINATCPVGYTTSGQYNMQFQAKLNAGLYVNDIVYVPVSLLCVRTKIRYR